MTSDHKTDVNMVDFPTAHHLHAQEKRYLSLLVHVALSRKMARQLIHGCSSEMFCQNSVRRETVWSVFFGTILSSKMYVTDFSSRWSTIPKMSCDAFCR